MVKDMKRFKLIIGILLATATLTFSIGVGSISVFAETQASTPEDDIKISISDNFDGKSVLVVMTEEVGRINKVYNKSFLEILTFFL